MLGTGKRAMGRLKAANAAVRLVATPGSVVRI
jgi:hypothetical protein